MGKPVEVNMDKVLEAMKSQGMTGYRLSKISGVSQSALVRLLNKQTKPIKKTWLAICKTLQLDEDGEPLPTPFDSLHTDVFWRHYEDEWVEGTWKDGTKVRMRQRGSVIPKEKVEKVFEKVHSVYLAHPEWFKIVNRKAEDGVEERVLYFTDARTKENIIEDEKRSRDEWLLFGDLTYITNYGTPEEIEKATRDPECRKGIDDKIMERRIIEEYDRKTDGFIPYINRYGTEDEKIKARLKPENRKDIAAKIKARLEGKNESE